MYITVIVNIIKKVLRQLLNNRIIINYTKNYSQKFKLFSLSCICSTVEAIEIFISLFTMCVTYLIATFLNFILNKFNFPRKLKSHYFSIPKAAPPNHS